MSTIRDTVRRMSAPKSPPGQTGYGTGMRGFFGWMRARNPRLYAQAIPAIKTRATLSGLGITGDAASAAASVSEAGPTAPGIVDKIKDILFGVSQAYLTAEQLKAQKKILDVQLQRAQAGLAPLDINMAQYGIGPQATVGLSSDTRSMLLWGAAILGAAYLVPKLIK